MNMVHRILSILTSLRLTVVLLLAALVVVFVGTLAQVQLGLYAAQSEFFRSVFVYWTPPGTHWKIPVLPGGWLLGSLLLVNLLAAHIKRFKFTPKKYGIILIHGGLIFLLLGQFLTELFQVESTMLINIGETKNYTEDSRRNELAVIDVTDPAHEKVVAIPETLVEKGGDIHTPDLPFALRVEKYLPNSLPAGPMSGEGEKIKATDGIGQRLLFSPAKFGRGMEDENRPTALVQVLSNNAPVSEWTVSTWMTPPRVNLLQEELGSLMGDLSLTKPQTFSYGGRDYQIALRPVRYYKPYSVKLLAFTHDIYPGTDIPKNFSSKIHISDPATGEDRDVLIYMNNPLRYHGETFYQASFLPNDRATILQVVRNPASITPYAACSLIALGLIVQFLMHLFSFARKQAQQAGAGPTKRLPVKPTLEPLAGNGRRSRL
jgi:hypothetical protein